MMARSKSTNQRAEIAELIETDADMPEWKRQSVERSLQAARGRAQQRSDRFVNAAIELMGERGSTDFTVQDVVDRSRMSIRTFYNFFASKDDLLLAVHETILATEAAPRLRKLTEAERDPVQRLRAYVEGLYEMTSHPSPLSRALTVYGNRLAETRPDDLERAFKPQTDLVVELVRGLAEAGRLQSRLSAEIAAHLLHHTVLVALHARILGTEYGQRVSAADLWNFCASGIGVDPTPKRRR
jgi:AcrR family transcriptional regulator